MAQQQFKIVPKRTPKRKKVIAGKFELETALPDISLLGRTIQIIAASQIKGQIKLKNPPSNIVVDNQDTKPFNQAQYRIVAYFSNTDSIAYAAASTIFELERSTRKRTGTAKRSYEIWTVDSKADGGKKVYDGIPGIAKLKSIAATLKGPEDRLVVAGPMTEYGRKLYWRPKSLRKRASDKPLKRRRTTKGFDTGSGQIVRLPGKRNTNMRDLVIPRVKKKHKDVVVYGRWVRADSVNGNNEWPGIAIGLRTKGRLR